MFNTKAQAEIDSLKRDLQTVQDRMGRTDYRDRRTDSWLDVFPLGVAEALGCELTDFKSGRRDSEGKLSQGGQVVADFTVSSWGHVMNFSAVLHPEAGYYTLVLDDTPKIGDVTPEQMEELETWYRHALTGKRFSPQSAAKTINAL